MGFVVKHTPIGGLVETAARAAGARQLAAHKRETAAFQRQQNAINAQRVQAQAAQDAADRRQQEALQTSLAKAQLSADVRRQEISARATALQDAAAARRDRTPTARTAGEGPVARAIKARLGALDKLKAGGSLTDDTYEEARLRVITGGRAPSAPRPRTPKTPSAAEARRDNVERGRVIEGIRAIRERLKDPKLTEAQSNQLIRQQVKYVGQATERWGEDWETRPGTPIQFPKKPRVDTRGVPSMPAREDIIPGQVVKVKRGPYKGRDVFWNEKAGKFQLVN